MTIPIDITRPLLKVEGERAVEPSKTVEMAKEAAARIGLVLEAEVTDIGGVFFVSKLTSKFRSAFPPFARGVRIAGKGHSASQCLASCYMELIERLSLYRYAASEKKEHICLDLRDGRGYALRKAPDITNTVCAAAGNNYEEAVLHALHELVETRIQGADLFSPHKTVPLELLATPYPDWVKENFTLIKSPAAAKEIHHITALQYPPGGQMDLRTGERAIKAEGRLFFSSNPRPLNHHSPASGSAAGLGIDACAHRAMAEVLQGTDGALGERQRKAVPADIPVAAGDELLNFETDSVTGDIRRILDILGEDVFVGVVDVSDKEMGIPVVKLISDYEPRHSLVSPKVLGHFYEGPF